MKHIACTIGLALLITGCGDQDVQSKTENNAGAGPSGPETSKPIVSSSTTAAPDAANSGINDRDKGHPAVTAIDQGNSEPDRMLTANIRKEVVADSSLSLNAHNVKIISSNGMVTLRGPVDSVEERTRIDTVAAKYAGAGKVDNQLEIAARNK